MSATSETVIGMLVLVPAFMAVDYLGRLADIERATIMGARYAAWEHATGTPSREVVQDRIHGSDHAGLISARAIADAGVSTNPMHQALNGHLIDPDDEMAISTQPPASSSDLPGTGPGSAAIAHGRYVPGAVRIGGLSGQMLNLPEAPLSVHRHRVTVNGLPLESDEADDVSPITLSATHGRLERDWQAHSDREFQRRTEEIVASEPISLLTRPAPLLGRFPIFKEGRYARTTDFIPPSRVLSRPR